MRKGKVKKSNQFSILTVDDDAIMTSTLKSYFEHSGYIVETENNPSAAIERVRNGKFDILLLDFLMSPICGDKVVEEIRSFNKDIYIILLTGHKSMAPPIKTIREPDIQGYYEKSDRFDQLELLVESCTKSIMQMRTIRGYQDELSPMYQNLKDNYVEVIQAMRTLAVTPTVCPPSRWRSPRPWASRRNTVKRSGWLACSMILARSVCPMRYC